MELMLWVVLCLVLLATAIVAFVRGRVVLGGVLLAGTLALVVALFVYG